jgi:hypothetical protein
LSCRIETLVREYRGERHTVTVVANGFVWREATACISQWAIFCPNSRHKVSTKWQHYSRASLAS